MYALAEFPEFFEEKMSIIVTFSPAITITNNTSQMLTLLDEFSKLIIALFKLTKKQEILPNGSLQTQIMQMGCVRAPQLCSKLDEMVADEDPTIQDYETMQKFLWHYPSGSSWKTFLHLQQIWHAEQFQRFDYEDENMLRYN